MSTLDTFFEIEIDDLNSSGQGVGSMDRLKVFVDLALPKETVKAKLVTQKKKYALATLSEIKKESPDRVDPICPIFEQCGGCQIMHLKYEKQLEFKTKRVHQALKRIGKIEDVTPLLCLPSPNPLYYRNKIQLPFFSFRGKTSLGLYKKHSNDIVEVDECFIHCKLGEKVYKTLKKLLENISLEVFDAESKKGFLRHLLIRSAVLTKECLVVFITHTNRHQKLLSALAEELMVTHPEVKGVLQNVNRKRYNSIMGDTYHLLKGRGHIFEEMSGLRFKISAHAFFQVNPYQAIHLYETALKLADLKPEDRLLDAYCGIGMFALFAASKVKHVLGIESSHSAIEDAKENAKLNELNNTEFECAHTEKIIDQLDSFDVAIINPPRKGCDPKVLQALSKNKLKKVIYVSCDPASLARDLSYLTLNGYTLEKIQPLDMFPQTTHVESIALLVKKTSSKS